ncbi:MAG: DNA polymerase [Desulfomicrobium escambiense]|nr:DNA polymerase [Desulfomicrobium escambiense]
MIVIGRGRAPGPGRPDRRGRRGRPRTPRRTAPRPTRARLVGLSFSLVPGEAFYVPRRARLPRGPGPGPEGQAPWRSSGPSWRTPKVRKTGQNIKYDLIVLEREGVRPDRPGPGHHGPVLPPGAQLGAAQPRTSWPSTICGEAKTPYEEVAGKGKNEPDHGQGRRRAGRPLRLPGRRARPGARPSVLWDQVRRGSSTGLYEDVERPLVGLLARMEIVGVRVDPDGPQGHVARARRASSAAWRRRSTPWPGGLQHQLAAASWPTSSSTSSGCAPARRDQGHQGLLHRRSTCSRSMAEHPSLTGLVLEYRQMAKLKSTYADALPDAGRPGRPAASTPPTTRPWPPPGGCPARASPTSRTSRSGSRLGRAHPPGLHPGRRAAPPVPPTTPRSSCASWPTSRRIATLIETFLRGTATSTRRRPGWSSAMPRPAGRPGGGPRSSTSASSTGRRPSRLARELGILGRRGPEVHRPLLRRAAAASASTSTGSSTRPASAAIRRRSSAGGGRSPSCGPRTGNLQQAGRRIALNNPIQGSAADIIKIAMVRVDAELARRKLGRG